MGMRNHLFLVAYAICFIAGPSRLLVDVQNSEFSRNKLPSGSDPSLRSPDVFLDAEEDEEVDAVLQPEVDAGSVR